MVATFTTPLTWASNTPISEANLNTYVRDNTDFLHSPPMCFIASATSVTSLSNGSEGTIGFDAGTTEYFDTDAMWTSPNDYIECTVTGIYRATCSLGFWLNASGERSLRLFKGGTAVDAVGPVPGTATSHGQALQVLKLSTLLELAVNDQVSMKGLQDSGGSLNAGGNFYSYLQLEWVGAE